MADSPTPRHRLLTAVLEHVAENGVHDMSLRALAEAAGSSHRMLKYHFGSRRGLLTEISRAVEQQQRQAFTAMLDDADRPPLQVFQEMWARIADPALASHERLFFELYARALRDPDGADGFAPEVVEAWMPALVELFQRFGLTPEEAAAEGRLALALSRGLLLDLLATGDHSASDAVMERYVARFPPARLDRGD